MLLLNLFVDAPLKATTAADADQSTEGPKYLGLAASQRPPFLEDSPLPAFNGRDAHLTLNWTVSIVCYVQLVAK